MYDESERLTGVVKAMQQRNEYPTETKRRAGNWQRFTRP
jgi:hypothetical protein